GGSGPRHFLLMSLTCRSRALRSFSTLPRARLVSPAKNLHKTGWLIPDALPSSVGLRPSALMARFRSASKVTPVVSGFGRQGILYIPVLTVNTGMYRMLGTGGTSTREVKWAAGW